MAKSRSGIRLTRTRTTSGSTADRVVHTLVAHIRRHRLTAGAALPSEIQTSAQLDVSRGIVREAYRSLSSAGIVTIVNGSSPRVGHVSSRALAQILQHAISTRQATAAQVLELREPIDERAAELAASNRSSEDVDELRQAVAVMRSSKSRRDLYVKADIRFHEVVGRATGNPLFRLVGSALREALGISIRASLAGRTSTSELSGVIDTHAAIVDAIEARRTDDARRLMHQHYEEARTSVLRQTLTFEAGPIEARPWRDRRR